MRPLRLELEGFTAFRDRISLDLTDLDLFAITGPTGAGKSSLVDAMAYALYGRVPRVANRVEACIGQGLPRMFVEFEFEAGTDRYRIFREARRQGRGNIRMERMLQGEWEPLEDRSTGVEERVKRILGLDFDGFTRSVLLPQGQFQEFLAGSPDKRREVLRGLLRLDVYERVRARVSGIERELHRDLVGIEQRLRDDYADATLENLNALEHERQGAADAADAVAEEIAALERGVELARALAEARGRFAAARIQLREAQTKLDEAQKLLSEGSARIKGVEETLTEIDGRLGENAFDAERYRALASAVTVAQDLVAAASSRDQAVAALVKIGLERDKAHRSVAEAIGLQAQCVEGREAADAELQHAERHNAAAVVQGGLSPGESCPVCGAVVGALPPIECPDLDRSRAEASAARNREASAREIVAQVRSELAGAETSVQMMDRRLQELEDHGAQLRTRLAATLPPGVDSSPDAIEAALKEQDRLRLERVALEKQAQEARIELERLRRGIDEAQADVVRLGERRESAREAQSEAEATGRTALQSLQSLARSAGWSDVEVRVEKEDVAPMLQAGLLDARDRQAALKERAGRLGALIEQLQEQIQKRASLEADLKNVRARHDVAADLAQVLRADRFQTFVQSEALRLLAEEGSHRLATLSGGRYTLSVAASSQDFDVVDQWNADQARSVRTLSGGETFLASLALALALAETLPGLAASRDVALDSMFLDEGFGSLDPEALDRAAEALDSLRAANRTVCVITHLQELADRLPARIVVQKSETGSTVEVR